MASKHRFRFVFRSLAQASLQRLGPLLPYCSGRTRCIVRRHAIWRVPCRPTRLRLLPFFSPCYSSISAFFEDDRSSCVRREHYQHLQRRHHSCHQSSEIAAGRAAVHLRSPLRRRLSRLPFSSMGQNRLTLVVQSRKGQPTTIQSAESAQQRARWLRLADIALGNPVHDHEEDVKGILHPGQKALEEHKRVIREVRETADKKVKRAA